MEPSGPVVRLTTFSRDRALAGPSHLDSSHLKSRCLVSPIRGSMILPSFDKSNRDPSPFCRIPVNNKH